MTHAKTIEPDTANFEPIETASRDEIQALQLKRMKWSLRHAYDNVARYKEKFDAAGVHPDDLKELSDLARFPFTAKADLRETYPFGMFAVPRQQLTRIHASSGTTGKPTVVGYTKNDLETWTNVVARTIRAGGARPGDLMHVTYGYGLFTGGLGFHYGAERVGCTVVPMSGGQTVRQIQLIQDFKPRIIAVTPSYMLNILDEMDRLGVDPHSTSLEIGLYGAEPWSEEIRSKIQGRSNIAATDNYGLSEIIGPGVAGECIETRDGLHIWEDHFYPEIIDPETGDVLPDGEFGELVFTSLTKEALPMVRYRTRDLTRLMPGTARTLRRMEKITGRSDDMMILRGVNVFPTQIEEQILKDQRFAPHYQIEMYKDGAMDAMRVHAELAPNAGGPESDAAKAATASLIKAIKDMIGISVKIQIHPTGGVPRSEGKAARVIDNRAK